MDVVASLFNNCDPLKPPPEGTYVDLYPARGDTAVVSILERRIRRAATPINQNQAVTYTHLLFSGHPGSGKSTELLRLCERLKNPQGNSVDRFFPIYMDADDYVNRYDVELIEILLGIVSSVAECLRKEEDIHLESSYLKSRWQELKEILLSPVEIKEVEFSLSEFAKFTTELKRADSDSRVQVRKKLTPQLPSLLDEINLVLESARAKLRKRGYHDLVLVIDNLEKIPNVRDPDTERGTHYWLFIESGEQLNSIEAHTVLSVPLPLIYSPQHAPLTETFGEKPIVLPMVKVEGKNGYPYEDGLKLMCEVLERRFEITGVDQAEVFDSPDTFRHLCRMSGGHVRNLLIYFRTSSDYVDSLPFTADAVRLGVRQHINAYSRSIPEGRWKLLARLHRDPDKHIPSDEDHQEMLGDLSILEYMNGGEPWYAVNPVVRELDKFKQALEDVKPDEGETS